MGRFYSTIVTPLRTYLASALGLTLLTLSIPDGQAIAAPFPSSQIGSDPIAVSLGGSPVRSKQLFDIDLESRSLRQGNRGADVESLQRALDREGLYTGAFDGIYGPDTAQGVSDFQRQNGLNPTGQADSRTLDALGLVLPGEALAATPTRQNFASDLGALTQSELNPGDTGPNVVILQRALNRNGARLSEDGAYGPATTQAVRAFQQQQGLSATGQADGRTLQVLGFRSRRNRYVAAIIEHPRELSQVQRFYPNAIVDSARQGNFINIGSYPTRPQARERVNAARARGLDARILYR